MMHYPSCNINTSTDVYEPSSYYYSSPSLFPGSPLYHLYTHENGYTSNNEQGFFQDFLENHHEIMIHPQQQNPLEINNNINNNNNNIDKCKKVAISSPRKKIFKKERQTKIQTAQGPRERRMRLSLNIARKFFDLQDMLGFRKASQTVEWLLTKSLSSITELSRSFQHQNWTSTSEIVMDEFSCNGKLEKGMLTNNNDNNSELKKGKTKVVRRIRPLAKKSREEARKRARERTMEKMSNLQKTRSDAAGYGGSLVGAGCWIPSSNAILHLQQNGGIIHGFTNLSGNLGEAKIW